jgi:hypothetical protein
LVHSPKLAVTENLSVTKPYAEQLWAELADARTSPVELSLQMCEGVTARWCANLDENQVQTFRSSTVTRLLSRLGGRCQSLG